jgi:hypothetical protein
MRSVQELLEEVGLDARGRPLHFRRRGRVHAVTEHLDAWRFGGRWWLGELPRACFLVRSGTLVAELHHEDARAEARAGEDRSTGRWWLARVQD